MKQPRSRQPLPAIGWREWVALPELGISWIKSKVDSGARTSSLHAFDIEYGRKGGEPYVRFKVHPLQRNQRKTVIAEAPLLERRHVKSSSGHLSLRPVIVTPVQLMDQTLEVEITLASRDAMGFRMLLGRQAIRGKFVIDAGRSYLAGHPPASQSG